MSDDDNQLAYIARRFRTTLDKIKSDKGRLLPGQLSARLPFDLSLPQDVKILGTLINEQHIERTLLETNLLTDEVLTFLGQQFEANGWRKANWPSADMSEGGFVHFVRPSSASSSAFAHMRMYLHDDTKGYIGMITDSGVEMITAVDLMVYPNGEFYDGMKQQRPFRSIFPQLPPPANAIPQGGGGQTGDGYRESRMSLKTKLTSSEISAYYEAYFEKAGWQRHSSGQAGPVDWQAWTYVDEDNKNWRIQFYNIQNPFDPQVYQLSLQAARQDYYLDKEGFDRLILTEG